MATYKLHYGTQAQFDAAKAAGTLNADHLYFTSDTLCIYKGENLLSASVEAVSEFPASGAQGRIYVNSETLESKVWNGSAWTVVSPAVETTLTAETATTSLATAGAIRTYVAGAIADAQAGMLGNADIVKAVAYDEATQKITVTKGDDSTAELLLKNLLTGAAYDGATGNFTFTTANGEAVVVNTPVENFLASAEYDEATHILTMTLSDGTEVPVDLADLIDAYTAEATSTVDLQVVDNKFTANVKVSAAENNALVANEDGLFVAVPADALILDVSDTTSVDLNVGTGTLTAEVKVSAAAGNAIAVNDDGLFVAPTDLSNYYTKAETYTQEEVNAAIDAAVEAAMTWEAI